MDQIAVWIERSEEGVWNDYLPYVMLHLGPPSHDLGAGDDNLLAWSCLIDDPFGVGEATARRGDTFAVYTFVYGDDIAGLGKRRRCGNRFEWPRWRTGVSVVPLGETWYSRRLEVAAIANPWVAAIPQTAEIALRNDLLLGIYNFSPSDGFNVTGKKKR